MDIIVARTITGEIIIGKKTSSNIEKCVALRVVQSSQTQIETHIVPVLHPFSEELVSIEYDKIIFSALANKELADKYIQSTSGISIVQNIDTTPKSNITQFPFITRRR